MEIFSRFNLPPRPKTIVEGTSMTLQSAADECDINKMIARFQKTGSYHGIANQPAVKPQFGDFSDVPSFETAHQIIIDATDHFASLPSVVRDRFGNNPAKMLEFMALPENYDEAVKLGICAERPKPPPEIVLEVAEEGGKTLLKKRSS